MGQVTIYLDDEQIGKIKRSARRAGESVSRWIARVVGKELESRWPEEVREAFGTWGDFPTQEEMRRKQGRDVKREPL